MSRIYDEDTDAGITEKLTALAAEYLRENLPKIRHKIARGEDIHFRHKLLLGWRKVLAEADRPHVNEPLSRLGDKISETLQSRADDGAEGTSALRALKAKSVLRRLRQCLLDHPEDTPLVETVANTLHLLTDQGPFNEPLAERPSIPQRHPPFSAQRDDSSSLENVPPAPLRSKPGSSRAPSRSGSTRLERGHQGPPSSRHHQRHPSLSTRHPRDAEEEEEYPSPALAPPQYPVPAKRPWRRDNEDEGGGSGYEVARRPSFTGRGRPPHQVLRAPTSSAAGGGGVLRPSELDVTNLTRDFYYRALPPAVLLRELLYPLQGIDGMYIKYNETHDAFLIRRDVDVSPTIRILTARLCRLGIHYRRVRSYVDTCILPPSSAKLRDPAEVLQWWEEGPSVSLMPSSTLVDADTQSNVKVTVQSPSSSQMPSTDAGGQEGKLPMAAANDGVGDMALAKSSEKRRIRTPVRSLMHTVFCQFLREELADYYKLLALMEFDIVQTENERLHKTPAVSLSVGSTLQMLITTLQDPLQRMRTLAMVTELVHGLKAGPLLSTVFNFSCRGDTLSRTLLMDMLKTLTTAWCEFVTAWMTEGVIVDPFDEFFVCRCPPPVIRSFIADGAESDEAGCLPEFVWKHGYSIHPSRVPVFLSRKAPLDVLITGKAVALIKLFKHLEASKLQKAATHMISTALVEARGSPSSNTPRSVSRLSEVGKQDPQAASRAATAGTSPLTVQRSASSCRLSAAPAPPEARLIKQRSFTLATLPSVKGRSLRRHQQHLRRVTRVSLVNTSEILLGDHNPLCDDTGSPTPGNAFDKEGDRKERTAEEMVALLRLWPHAGPRKRFAFSQPENQDRDDAASTTTKSADFVQLDSQALLAFEEHIAFQKEVQCRRVVEKILFRYHLICHCEAIRRLLLGGQGDFFDALLRQFSPRDVAQGPRQSERLDVTGCNLSCAERNVPVHRLQTCLQSAIANSNARYFPAEVLERVRMVKVPSKEHEEQQGWEVASLSYNALYSPTSLVINRASLLGYQKLSCLMMRASRANATLQRVWIDHIRNFRRRQMPLHLPQRGSSASTTLALNTFDERSQKVILSCESMFRSLSHLIRNLQSYLCNQVVELSWMEFVERVSGLVDWIGEGGGSCLVEEGDVSSVDALIRCHEDYVASLLCGSFLAEQVNGAPLPCAQILSLKHSNNFKNPAAYYASQIPLLLAIFELIVSYAEQTDICFSELHRWKREREEVDEEWAQQLDDGEVSMSDSSPDHYALSQLGPAISDPVRSAMAEIEAKYKELLLEFLRRMNTIAKTSAGLSSVRKSKWEQFNNLGAVRHSDGIRAFLTSFDFNDFFGTRWEIRAFPGGPVAPTFTSSTNTASFST